VRPVLFSITCTTCHARLGVRGMEAIGAILECPKCGCMVPVIPPEGWQPPKPPIVPIEPVSQSGLASGAANGATPEIEGAGDQNIASTCNTEVAVQGIVFRFFHSWFAISLASAAAIATGLIVWMVFLSTSHLENTSKSTAGKSEVASTGVSDATDKQDADTHSPEQTAINKSVELAPAAAVNQADKPDAQAAADKSAAVIPKANPEQSETKTPKTIEPDRQASDVAATETNKPEAKPTAEEKNQPAGVATDLNKTDTEPAPPAIETSKMVKLVAPDVTDLQSRLSMVIPKVDFRNMPFARAIGLVAALSGLPVTIDPDALIREQVSLHDPISVRLTGATVEEVLQDIVGQRALDFVGENGQVIVTSPADQREKIRRIRYTVSDLIGKDKTATDQLAVMLQKLLSQESWQSGGGQGTIETDQTALIVNQTGVVHDQILVFCEKLRNARGLPLKSNRNPKRFELTTRIQQAEASLKREVSANFHEPGTLVDILAYLGQQAEVDILLDRQALAAAGLSDQSEVSFAVENKPLATALTDLLDPIKLGFRAIDAHTLQVTTKSALNATRELEFYQLGKMTGKEIDVSNLIEQIKTTISPNTWTDANPPTAIYFDQPSSTLIVLQSPSVQGTVQACLTNLSK
jgi:hypothetical protein